MKEKRIILAGYVNTKSELLYNRDVSRREKLEAYIVANYLEICNALGELCKYIVVKGIVTETSIDITIRTNVIYVDDWKVLNKGNSDYRLIVFTLRTLKINQGGGAASTKGGFVLRQAD